jgi:hypothetical protein
MKKLLFFVLLSFGTMNSAIASNAVGTVSKYWVINNGTEDTNAYLIIEPSTTNGGSRGTNIPTCGANNPEAYAISITTAKGKAMYAQVLTAYATGKTLYFGGSNECAEWGDREGISYLIGQ